MSDTTTRALSLLNLLQTHRHWPGSELAGRLGVTERTVRRDVERLRELGYRIESTPGAAGGYRLEAGSAVPPLLLTDDEAVAMAIGLRVAASQRLLSGAETTVTALAKLEQVLPAPLRRRVNALAETVQPTGIRSGAAVSSELLGELALATRDHERVRFTHTSSSGEVMKRRVEPHALAPAERHWYLLCWDLDRDDWRTFRVDRLSDVEHTRVLFTPRPLTPEQIDEFIAVARSWSPQAVAGAAVMDLGLDDMRAYFGQWGQGAQSVGPGRTSWPVGGSDFREVMYALAWIPSGVPYTVELPDSARKEMCEALVRMLAALDPAGT
ncbi:WYL domain-containing protein [Microbacterium jejuense]|uniref:WYL domain-containing protein n=1 Tax=Microbacterium jejuense TaxID=1263637 RepID=A0ABS7HPX4_9MICO|nr:WYL domain-containing protein [Microbacterium jejuense]MBW9094272.1 WYL domain-containing protein [Microbacterium jejuense]